MHLFKSFFLNPFLLALLIQNLFAANLNANLGNILGIVNISGSLEFMVLQNTRLYTVMLLANTISNGIHHCILKSVGFKKNILDSTLENIL